MNDPGFKTLNLTIMFFILELESKNSLLLLHAKNPSPKKTMTKTFKPPLIPYYQKVLPRIMRCQPFPTSQIHSQKPLPYYMLDHASPSYSQDFPPLESVEHPQTNTKYVWKIENPVGTNPDGTRRQISLAEAALNWQAENVMAQNQALSKILDNQQKLAEIVTHTFSSSGSLNDDLKKKNQDG